MNTSRLRRPRFGAILVAATAACAFASALAGNERPRVPRFSLEQAVHVPTIGRAVVSPDGRRAAIAIAGHYFGFPVVPRLGFANNIRVVDLDSGEIRDATSGRAPKTAPVFSQAGDRVAYESEGDIWIVRLADGRTTRVTTNAARDSRASWSPDGRRIAFVSNRGGGSHIWIASDEGERHSLTRLTSGGEMSTDDPQWSPDGTRIAYSAKGPLDFYASRIFVVAATGGTPKQVTPDDEFDHSQPRFSPDGTRLAFVSDRSGYMHVWTMRADGSEAREYDSGPFDSTSPHFDVAPVWSPDGRRILVSRNRDGRFELVVLDVETGSIRVARSGPGQYHEAGWGTGGRVVYTYENAWSPPDLYAGPPAGSSRQLTFSSHVMFREAHTANLERVRFPSTGEIAVPGFVMTPRQMTAGARLPAIVLLHPNGYGQFYDHWNPFFHYLAESGYVLLLVDQRGSAGYGRAFRLAQVGNWGTGTFDDVVAAAGFVKTLPYVDPARVGVMGLSFGGYQTLLALTRTPELFKAGADLMGPTDRRGRSGDRYRELQIGAKEAENPELYERISPIALLSRMRAPLLVIHSDQDRNVAPEDTYRLVAELERLGKRYEAVVYPGEAHGLADPEHQLDSYRRILTFFDRWLQP